MKIFNVLLFAFFLSGCGGGGGQTNGATPTVPVDNAPHDYTAGFFNDNGLVHTVTIHQECNVGFAGFRDDTATMSTSVSGDSGALGCGGAKNYRATFTNIGAVTLYLTFTVDGVWRPDLTYYLPPAGVYIFERGF